MNRDEINKILEALKSDEEEATTQYDVAIQLLKDEHPEIAKQLMVYRNPELEHYAGINEMMFDKEEETL